MPRVKGAGMNDGQSDGQCYWVLRVPGGVLLSAAEDGANWPLGRAEDFAALRGALAIGQWRGQRLCAAELDTPPANAALQPHGLRAVFGLLGMEGFALAARAVQLLDWQHQHRFCGACAAPTQRQAAEFSMLCPACRLSFYPRLSPAVMVLVRRGSDLLLARSPRFPPGVYSALAGFVEPGETLEECALREVREEVGIAITNLRYFASQSWPFPNSLMLAFFADYASGELQPDGQEIESAQWFPRTHLPPLPMPMSIAHRLIKAALG